MPSSNASPKLLAPAASLSEEEWLANLHTKCQRVAKHLKETHSGVPWYAQRAKCAAEETGDEMNYWLDLAGSCPNLLGNDPPT